MRFCEANNSLFAVPSVETTGNNDDPNDDNCGEDGDDTNSKDDAASEGSESCSNEINVNIPINNSTEMDLHHAGVSKSDGDGGDTENVPVVIGECTLRSFNGAADLSNGTKRKFYPWLQRQIALLQHFRPSHISSIPSSAAARSLTTEQQQKLHILLTRWKGLFIRPRV